jgi:glycosyltransferase involved in cell wall biosynthesis
MNYFMSKRLAILADYPEENWPSMDLVAEMLTRELQADPSLGLAGERICPEFKWRASAISKKPFAQNVDRLLNRMRDYPRFASKLHDRFDLFHVCDHSYSQIVHALPAERTGVFCHDLDTFRCILEPNLDPRPRWFRAMTRRILSGLQKAAIVFHTTDTVRAQIIKHGLIDPARLVQAPYGVSPEFNNQETNVELPIALDRRIVLHVGSCIPRKRIDVLLSVFAELLKAHPDLRLVQVGGEWTADQRAQIERLAIASSTTQLPRQGRPVIAQLYRSASVVLMPSEAEGFGLPVAEALTCGAIVVASDIPVLREVGGDAAIYCPLADVPAWSKQISLLLQGRASVPTLQARLARASIFSWKPHASTVARAYLNLRT